MLFLTAAKKGPHCSLPCARGGGGQDLPGQCPFTNVFRFGCVLLFITLMFYESGYSLLSNSILALLCHTMHCNVLSNLSIVLLIYFLRLYLFTNMIYSKFILKPVDFLPFTHFSHPFPPSQPPTPLSLRLAEVNTSAVEYGKWVVILLYFVCFISIDLCIMIPFDLILYQGKDFLISLSKFQIQSFWLPETY